MNNELEMRARDAISRLRSSADRLDHLGSGDNRDPKAIRLAADELTIIVAALSAQPRPTVDDYPDDVEVTTISRYNLRTLLASHRELKRLQASAPVGVDVDAVLARHLPSRYWDRAKAAFSALSPQPAADAEWIKHPQTIEAKRQWDAVAQALGADGDCPDAVLAAAKSEVGK